MRHRACQNDQETQTDVELLVNLLNANRAGHIHMSIGVDIVNLSVISAMTHRPVMLSRSSTFAIKFALLCSGEDPRILGLVETGEMEFLRKSICAAMEGLTDCEED